MRVDRECSRKLRDGPDLVRVATPLCRTELRHLGLFGFVYQQVWLVHVYCLKKVCQILMSERKGLFNFRKEVRFCASRPQQIRQHEATFPQELHAPRHQGVGVTPRDDTPRART